MNSAPPPDGATSANVAQADTMAELRRAMPRAARTADPANTLAMAQLQLLSCLAEYSGARTSQRRLAPNSVTTPLNGLHARGLVTCASGSSDQRTMAVSPSPAGARAVHQWQGTNAAILRTAVACLCPGRQHLLAAALRELATAADSLADQAPQLQGADAT